MRKYSWEEFREISLADLKLIIKAPNNLMCVVLCSLTYFPLSDFLEANKYLVSSVKQEFKVDAT